MNYNIIFAFEELALFHQGCQILFVEFMLFSFYPSEVYRVCSDIFGFIPDIGNLYLFIFISIARGLSVLLILLKNQILLVSLDYLCFFLYAMLFISIVFFVVFFLLIVVDLFL